MSKEKIKFAAIKIMNYNVIIYDKNHEECYKRWTEINKENNTVKWENGFLTNKNRFVCKTCSLLEQLGQGHFETNAPPPRVERVVISRRDRQRFRVSPL